MEGEGYGDGGGGAAERRVEDVTCDWGSGGGCRHGG